MEFPPGTDQDYSSTNFLLLGEAHSNYNPNTIPEMVLDTSLNFSNASASAPNDPPNNIGYFPPILMSLPLAPPARSSIGCNA